MVSRWQHCVTKADWTQQYSLRYTYGFISENVPFPDFIPHLYALLWIIKLQRILIYLTDTVKVKVLVGVISGKKRKKKKVNVLILWIS